MPPALKIMSAPPSSAFTAPAELLSEDINIAAAAFISIYLLSARQAGVD